MASVTRVNGLRNTAGTLYADNCNLYLITVKNSSASAIDLRAEDDAIDEAVEQILKEINPLAFFVTNSSAGTICVIMDKSINSASELQTRIRRIGIDSGASTTSIGPNDVDISGTTVQDVQPTPALTTSGAVTFTAAS
jgi:hydroxymethylpyrimidine pyrophosphatase-like HAD family hydrolase